MEDGVMGRDWSAGRPGPQQVRNLASENLPASRAFDVLQAGTARAPSTGVLQAGSGVQSAKFIFGEISPRSVAWGEGLLNWLDR